MSDPEALLSALWAQDEPPARDPAFVAAVMAQAARRRLWMGMAALVAPSVALGALLWMAAPALNALIQGPSATADASMMGWAVAAASLGWLVGWGPLRNAV